MKVYFEKDRDLEYSQFQKSDVISLCNQAKIVGDIETRAVKIDLVGDRLVATAKSAGQGDFEGEIDAQETGGPINCMLDMDLLRSVVSPLRGNIQIGHDLETKCIRIMADQYSGIIATMHLQ